MNQAAITIENELRPLIPAFLTRMRYDIALCKVAVLSGHHSKLRALCHKNSGSCAMYGFAELSELFASLEQASLASRSRSQIGAAVERLSRYADRMEITFR